MPTLRELGLSVGFPNIDPDRNFTKDDAPVIAQLIRLIEKHGHVQTCQGCLQPLNIPGFGCTCTYGGVSGA